MATWREVEKLRGEHPDWGPSSIARELIRLGDTGDALTLTAYVRATFQRRGWANPNMAPRRRRPDLRAGLMRGAPAVAATAKSAAARAQPSSAAALPPETLSRGRAERALPYWLRD